MSFLAQGETEAFDELYNRYGKRLLIYFTRMLNFNREAAEDALQDLFMKIAESPARFDSSRSFKTWIYAVASNMCKNYYRHQGVVKQHAEESTSVQPINESAFLSVASSIDKKIFAQMLVKVLEDLSPEKREAFILKYQEDKSIAEIAEIQACPAGSVKSRLHYTLKILEEKLRMFHPGN
jgi:RNA polymerase sigma-70 factor (ECF subfamily)